MKQQAKAATPMTDGNTDWRARLRKRVDVERAAVLAAVRRPRQTHALTQRFYGPPPVPGTVLSVRVTAVPRGQPRPKGRIVRPKRGPSFIQFYDPHDADEWKAAVKAAFVAERVRGGIEGPVSCAVDFLLPRPKYLCTRWYVRNAAGELLAVCKPDRDNAEKAVLDALTDYGLWKDDAQVCAGSVRKFYHSIGERPGARITVEVLPPVPTAPRRGLAVGATPSLF